MNQKTVLDILDNHVNFTVNLSDSYCYDYTDKPNLNIPISQFYKAVKATYSFIESNQLPLYHIEKLKEIYDNFNKLFSELDRQTRDINITLRVFCKIFKNEERDSQQEVRYYYDFYGLLFLGDSTPLYKKFILKAIEKSIDIKDSLYFLAELLSGKSDVINFIGTKDVARNFAAMYYLYHNLSIWEKNKNFNDFKIIENDIELIKSNTQQDLTNLIEGYEQDRIIFEDALLGFSRKYTELEENMKALIKSSETKMVGLENAYNERLKISTSTELWNKKSEEFKKSSKNWARGLAVFVIIYLLVLNIIFVKIGEMKFFQNNKVLSQSVVLVSLISFGIYISRVFIKIILSNKHLQLYYQNKAALASLYVSLNVEGTEITEKEKLLVYTVLFKDVETGLVKSQDSNDIENLLNLLNKN